jgi:hypothetical protein
LCAWFCRYQNWILRFNQRLGVVVYQRYLSLIYISIVFVFSAYHGQCPDLSCLFVISFANEYLYTSLFLLYIFNNWVIDIGLSLLVQNHCVNNHPSIDLVRTEYVNVPFYITRLKLWLFEHFFIWFDCIASGVIIGRRDTDASCWWPSSPSRGTQSTICF